MPARFPLAVTGPAPERRWTGKAERPEPLAGPREPLAADVATPPAVLPAAMPADGLRSLERGPAVAPVAASFLGTCSRGAFGGRLR